MENKRMARLLSLITLCFVGLVVYMTYFQIFKAEKIASNSYNQRLSFNEDSVLRGSIYDKNRTLLASSYEGEDGTKYREYLYPHVYAHMIGYNNTSYGKTGLELAYNQELLNTQELSKFDELKRLLQPTGIGNDLILTVDNRLQERAYQLLEGHKGSVVLMNYRTGAVLAMANRPSFNPMNLDEIWEELLEDEESPLINRSTQGLYTPGSAYKIVTAASIMEFLPESEQIYYDDGETVIDGYKISNYEFESFGEIGLREAIINSVNTYFADMGVKVGAENLKKTTDSFYFNKAIPFDIPVAESRSAYVSEKGLTEIAAAAFGQGKTLVTPLQMALVAATVGNGGSMMEPMLVDRVVSPQGEVVTEKMPQELTRVMPVEMADTLKQHMLDTIDNGSRAQIEGVRVAGKTGTAETTSGLTHAWFIGCIADEANPYAIAVVLEEDGTLGGRTAAPIAREVFLDALYIDATHQ